MTVAADNKSMVKLSIRDLWGRATQKKAMKPEVRSMLMSLDGVYEPRKSVDAEPENAQHDDEPRGAAG